MNYLQTLIMLFNKLIKWVNPLLFLSTTFVFYIFRMVVPYANYLFIPLILLFALYFGYLFFSNKEYKKIIPFIKFIPSLIIIVLFYIYAFAQSYSNLFIIKDLLELAIVLFFAFTFFIIVNSSEKFKTFTTYFFKSISIFASIIALIGLVKFYFMLRGVSFQPIGIGFFGTALNSDYNFYILFSFLGIISVLYLINNKQSLFSNELFPAFIILLLAYNVLFSFSRRGFILIIAFVLISLIIVFIRSFNERIKKVLKNFTILFIITFSFLTLFVFVLPSSIKIPVLKVVGIPKINYKNTFQHIYWRYSNIFVDLPMAKASARIWKDQLNSLDPESGWDSRIGTVVEKLQGNNVEIVPPNAFGYLMDNSCNASSWGGNAFSYTSISGIFDLKELNDGLNWFQASVYCYVSEDFDGEWVRLSSEGNSPSAYANDYYNLAQKGTWQKLNIYFTAYNSLPNVYLYWSRYGDTDFSNLKGHVIFSYPTYSSYQLSSKNPRGWGVRKHTSEYIQNDSIPEIDGCYAYKMDSTSNADTWSGNAYSFTSISSLYSGDSLYQKGAFVASVYCYISEDFNGSWARISVEGSVSGQKASVYDLNNKGTWQKLQISFTSGESVPPVYLYWAKSGATNFQSLEGYVMFAYPEYNKVDISPKSPKGWGARIHSEVLIEGADIPDLKGCYAYKMDKTTNADSWDGNAFSYTNISSLYSGDTLINEGSFIASVYCFVSYDFNGSWVRINSEIGPLITALDYYDMTQKGSWQKLQIEFNSTQGPHSVYLYWSKSGVKDFSSLKGYVMYAYPQYYKVNESQQGQPLSLLNQKKSTITTISIASGFQDLFSRLKNINIAGDRTIIQDSLFYDSFVIEDDQLFMGSRTERWRYAWYLYKNEYSWYQKIIGNGFDYLVRFNYKFYDGERMDYPHNPFISVLLYSGIIGLIAYLWFIGLVFWYYIKYWKYHLFFFICFLVVFYFTFFSANTHFSVPALSIFSIIPFFTRYLVNQSGSKDKIIDPNI